MVRIQKAKSAAVIVAVMLANPVLADARKDADAAYAIGDYATYFSILVPLAKKGEAWAQTELGLAYATGTATTQDFAEAARWFELAAIQGDSDAQIYLGMRYEEGTGVPQDFSAAMKLYRQSSMQGRRDAKYRIAGLYEKGLGVEQDLISAHMWYSLVLQKPMTTVPYDGLYEGLAKLSLYNISKKMTPAQIAEAQKLARDCLARNLKGC